MNKKENKISYSRQTDIFDPIKQRLKIIILGAGSVGSFVTLNLAKLGFNDISVYDFDIVEKANIPNQFYRIKDIGKLKVDALKEIVKEFTDIDIKENNIKVTKDTIFEMSLDTLFVLSFDSLEQRKVVFDMIKDTKCHILDVRVGGEGINIQTTDTFNDAELKRWEKSFGITPTKLTCGAKSIMYINLNVASEVCNIVKKINNDEKYPRTLLRHMKNYDIIKSFEDKE